MKKPLPFLFLLIITILFFKDFFFRGLIPLPADTIVGMYHPWRDVTWNNYQNGVPFKNFLITDPVRQQYPWKFLVIENLKQGKLPLWNPYSFSGTPLLANFQSGVFYPLNIFFFILPFNTGWGMYIYSQFLFGSLFMYLYLKNLKVDTFAAVFGSLIFIFSGFFIAWGWWGNIIHTLLWLPLLLLCIDKITHTTSIESSKFKVQSSKLNPKSQILNNNLQPALPAVALAEAGTRNSLSRKLTLWPLLFIFSLCSSFFAGHLQVFFYVFVVASTYTLIKLIRLKIRTPKTFLPLAYCLLLFTFCLLLFAAITSIQWKPTLDFIAQSARSSDQANWQKEGWFIPWQHLIQFLAPDYFGNPATLNYWGIWNYGEFIGYIGVLPLIVSFYALVFRRDKKTLFFGTLFLVSLLFALPTFLAKIPYQLKLPLISTSQPTRLLAISDFSLAILAALGLDYLLKTGKLKSLLTLIIPFAFTYGLLFFATRYYQLYLDDTTMKQYVVASRNLILPITLFFTGSTLLILSVFVKNKNLRFIVLSSLFIVAAADTLRFGWKFLPFVKAEYIYPQTKTIDFLREKQKEGRFRIMAIDDRIFPPNFSVIYKIESVGGYDPLYLKSYADLINRMENRDPESSFERIITPKNYESRITDHLNVKYVLSLADLESAKLKKVFQEGETRVYENLNFKSEPYFENQRSDL